jgi:hypothetical protein
MPSSELSRCLAKYPPLAGSRENLLLGMLKRCVQAVGRTGEIFGKVHTFCAVSTAQTLSAKHCIGFVRNLYSTCAHIFRNCPQKTTLLSAPYFSRFYPLSTSSINTTNLIKE